MADARDVFSPAVLSALGPTSCQLLLDGLEALQASKAATVAGLMTLGQLMAQLRRSKGDAFAAEALMASHTLTVAEGTMLERVFVLRPEWLDPSAVDLADPLAEEVLQVGCQTYSRQCAAQQREVG